VSIVVVAKNEEQRIAACLDSLLGQDHQVAEIIIVNDGSTDGTESRAREYSAAHHRIRVVSTAGRSNVTHALNFGASHSRYPIIVFMGGDCVADENWISELTAAMEQGKTQVSTGRIVPMVRGSRWVDAEQQKYEAWTESKCNSSTANFLTGGNMAITRDFFGKLGGFDEDMVAKGDRDLARRAIQSGHQIAFAEEAVVKHDHPTKLSAFFHRGIWYARGLCSFNKKHHASWAAGSEVRKVLEPVWFLAAIVLLVAWALFLLPLAAMIPAEAVFLFMGFRRDISGVARAARRRTTWDTVVLDLVLHTGERIGVIHYLAFDHKRVSKPRQGPSPARAQAS
jgi:glycosyltransferase involved in cell wall biosynthesis